tara:strand:+ start:71 stop:364 length:294 start_codon:yes stop_codon:yes gene_type:complete
VNIRDIANEVSEELGTDADALIRALVDWRRYHTSTGDRYDMWYRAALKKYRTTFAECDFHATPSEKVFLDQLKKHLKELIKLHSREFFLVKKVSFDV